VTRARQARARAGEDAAVAALVAAGYTVVERNWRCPHGELDVVARQGGVLCFVEVKAVRGEGAGDPFEKVTRAKQRQVARAAAAYLQAERLGTPWCRFDVVGVWLGPDDAPVQVRIVPGAFEA
jgi:putative endonuclease